MQKYSTEKATCIKPGHGDYEKKVMGAASTGCPKCHAERDASMKAEEARREEENRRRRREINFRNSGIPERFHGKGFDQYRGDVCREAESMLAICRNYADRFATMRSQGTGIILSGNPGTGKTHLACAIAKQAIEADYSAYYTKMAEIASQVKESYRKDSETSELSAIKSFSAKDLLVIDEIGVQHGTDFERNLIFQIVNERYEALKNTILISNLDFDNLVPLVGERVIDRMIENGGYQLPFTWESQRGKVK